MTTLRSAHLFSLLALSASCSLVACTVSDSGDTDAGDAAAGVGGGSGSGGSGGSAGTGGSAGAGGSSGAGGSAGAGGSSGTGGAAGSGGAGGAGGGDAAAQDDSATDSGADAVLDDVVSVDAPESDSDPGADGASTDATADTNPPDDSGGATDAASDSDLADSGTTPDALDDTTPPIDAGDTDDGSEASAADAGGDSGDGATTGGIGAACAADADCRGNGLKCFTDTDASFDGAVAHGICTIDCTGDITLCDPYGANCVHTAGIDYCAEACTTGPSSQTDFSANKCHGRRDVACLDFSVFTACAPQCGDDRDCATGLHCSVVSGFCEAAAGSGDPIGTACDSTATSTCGGYCKADTGGDFCTTECVTGARFGCGYDAATAISPPTSGTLQMSACLYPNDAAGTYGDIGYCVQLCRTAADCNLAGATCDMTAPVEALGVCR